MLPKVIGMDKAADTIITAFVERKIDGSYKFHVLYKELADIEIRRIHQELGTLAECTYYDHELTRKQRKDILRHFKNKYYTTYTPVVYDADFVLGPELLTETELGVEINGKFKILERWKSSSSGFKLDTAMLVIERDGQYHTPPVLSASAQAKVFARMRDVYLTGRRQPPSDFNTTAT